MAVATDLREALRPVVAFRGELEKCTQIDELRLAVLEHNLPEHITRALDLHQALLTSLALGARIEAEEKGEVNVERKIDKQLAAEQEEQGVGLARPPAASFLDD
jgi:hypothetical protein